MTGLLYCYLLQQLTSPTTGQLPALWSHGDTWSIPAFSKHHGHGLPGPTEELPHSRRQKGRRQGPKAVSPENLLTVEELHLGILWRRVNPCAQFLFPQE